MFEKWRGTGGLKYLLSPTCNIDFTNTCSPTFFNNIQGYFFTCMKKILRNICNLQRFLRLCRDKPTFITTAKEQVLISLTNASYMVSFPPFSIQKLCKTAQMSKEFMYVCDHPCKPNQKFWFFVVTKNLNLDIPKLSTIFDANNTVCLFYINKWNLYK